MPAGSTKLRFISPSSRERCSLPTIFHRSHNSSTVSWIFKRATSKPLRPSNGPSRAPIFAPCWQSCNPEQPPLPPDKYVTVIPVQSTKLRILPMRGVPRIFSSDLERAIPNITQKMLGQQLRRMEADGIVVRKAYPEVPPKVEYSLTAWGQALCPALDAMLKWVDLRQ